LRQGGQTIALQRNPPAASIGQVCENVAFCENPIFYAQAMAETIINRDTLGYPIFTNPHGMLIPTIIYINSW